MILKEEYLHKVLMNVLKEEIDGELSPFDEYVNGYSDFKPEDVNINELLSFIRNSGDFLYYFNGNFHSANSNELVKEIYNDVNNGSVSISHDIDNELQWKWEDYFGNDDIYLVIFKVKPLNDKPYYILYIQEKYDLPYSMKYDV